MPAIAASFTRPTNRFAGTSSMHQLRGHSGSSITRLIALDLIRPFVIFRPDIFGDALTYFWLTPQPSPIPSLSPDDDISDDTIPALVPLPPVPKLLCAVQPVPPGAGLPPSSLPTHTIAHHLLHSSPLFLFVLWCGSVGSLYLIFRAGFCPSWCE